MKIDVKNEPMDKHKTEAIVVGLFEGEKHKLKSVDDALNNEISCMIDSKEFTAEARELKLIHTHRRLPFHRILLVGLGKKEKFDTEQLRRASAVAAKHLREHGVKKFTTLLHDSTADSAQAVTEGIILGLYQFRKYVTVDKDKIKEIKEATLLENKDVKAVQAGVDKGTILATNVNFARDLINEPADTVTPKYLANEARKIAKDSKIKVTVLGKKDMEKMGLGAILAVSRGSDEEPQLIVMDYAGAKEDPIVFVGKAVTFDSGGLNVKPAPYMEDMRSDMAGGATCLATMRAISQLGLKRRVAIVLPSCENMIGPGSYKQGDIVTAYNGKTIEVWHTDAEGRIILADALSYAEKHLKPKAMIDIATLTGASIIALGHEIVSMMSTDDKLKEKMLDASKKTGEMMWELPLLEDYKEYMQGDMGDIRNIHRPKTGPGVITGGIFLNHFVEDTPWIHLDIGAAGWAPSDTAYKKKGATGVCLRTFIKMLEDW